MKRIPRLKPSRMSTVAQIVPTENTAKLMREMSREWPARLREAKALFLADVASHLLRKLREADPETFVMGKEWRYGGDLRLGMIDGHGGVDECIVIFLDGKDAPIREEDLDTTALYFSVRSGSPKWVGVLARYNPWPAAMVPVEFSGVEARVVSRRMRGDERKALAYRLAENATRIESELREAGVSDPKVASGSKAVGGKANEDIGFNILRDELGMSGRSNSVWRPAIADTKRYARTAFRKVAEYVRSGRREVFDLPEKIADVGSSVIEDGMGFSKGMARHS